jgi:hypothetical protein
VHGHHQDDRHLSVKLKDSKLERIHRESIGDVKQVRSTYLDSTNLKLDEIEGKKKEEMHNEQAGKATELPSISLEIT